MLRSRRLALAWVLVPLWLGAGCVGLPFWSDVAQQDSFEDAQRRYTLLVRWGEFGRAGLYVDPEAREAFLASAERLRQVRFTDYQVRTRELHAEKTSATARVWYYAYWVTSMVETTFEEKQEWYQDEETGAWRVRPELRERSVAERTPRS